MNKQAVFKLESLALNFVTGVIYQGIEKIDLNCLTLDFCYHSFFL